MTGLRRRKFCPCLRTGSPKINRVSCTPKGLLRGPAVYIIEFMKSSAMVCMMLRVTP